ncbi:hypothetical protein CCP4SC76_6240002 [Gammaproteobacteria bacterium]
MLSLNPELGGIYDRIQALILSCTLTITKLHPVDFSRCRLLPLGKLIIVILSVVSGGRDKGIQTKLEEFFTAVRRSQVWANAQSPHRSTFTKARAKISKLKRHPLTSGHLPPFHAQSADAPSWMLCR